MAGFGPSFTQGLPPGTLTGGGGFFEGFWAAAATAKGVNLGQASYVSPAAFATMVPDTSGFIAGGRTRPVLPAAPVVPVTPSSMFTVPTPVSEPPRDVQVFYKGQLTTTIDSFGNQSNFEYVPPYVPPPPDMGTRTTLTERGSGYDMPSLLFGGVLSGLTAFGVAFYTEPRVSHVTHAILGVGVAVSSVCGSILDSFVPAMYNVFGTAAATGAAWGLSKGNVPVTGATVTVEVLNTLQIASLESISHTGLFGTST